MAGLTGGLNFYEYAVGNPIRYSDPSGYCPWCLVGAGLGAGLNIGTQLAQNGGNWGAIDPQSVGFAALQGFVGGGIGTLSSGLSLGANLAISTISSGVGAAGLTSAQNALRSCRGLPPQGSVVNSALLNAAFGGGGALAGTLVQHGGAALQRAISSSAFNNAPLSSQLLSSYLTSTSFFAPPNIQSWATAGTTLGNVMSNVISNIPQ